MHSVLPTLPSSVGAGLGNRATHLWHRTRFRSYGLWWFMAYSVLSLFFVLPTPPRSGAGGDLDKIDYAYWGTGPPRFLC